MSTAGTKSLSHSRRGIRTRELLLRAHDGSVPRRAERLRHQVVVENQTLAAAIAHQFDHKGMERDDLVQVAMVGLVQAARRYQPGAGHGFPAFAVPTIAGDLKRHFRDHGCAVRPPRALQEMCGRVRHATSGLEQELHHALTDREVAVSLEVPEGSVQRARPLNAQSSAASLDAPVRGATKTPLGEFLPDTDDEPYDHVVALVSLRSAMGHLDRRERVILRLRFVDNMTQRQVGRRIGVSRRRSAA